MAADELERSGIPCEKIQEDIGGLQTAQTASPQAGIGLQFIVRVPREMQEEARAIIERLPVSNSPAFGLPGMGGAARSGVKALAWSGLIVFAVSLLLGLYEILR